MAIEKLDLSTPDIVDENVAHIAALFPGVVTEGKDKDGRLTRVIDFDALKQELSDKIVEGPQERYRLDWPGKRAAMLAANTPITKTLRPVREESVDFDTTKNLFIEGDSLDALKLLQETYLGKVKMIYIDPPYNTGKDFIYKDNFTQDKSEYLEESGQVAEGGGGRLVTNLESGGRYHSDWLSMMYPRLKLARNLLRDDGVIFISIDDTEAASLKNLCDEIFGERNFVANAIWRSRTSISSDHHISMNHNHTLVYSRSIDDVEMHGVPLNPSDYKNPDNDERGPWSLSPLDANKPGGDTNYPILNPATGEEYFPPNGRSWAINKVAYQKLYDDDRIIFGHKGDSAPKKKLFLNERLAKGDSKTPSSVMIDAGTSKDGTTEVVEIFDGVQIFDHPKPTKLLDRLLSLGLSIERDSIVMDFFCGSGTTAHSVLKRKILDGFKCSFITVQLPEDIQASLPSLTGRAKKTAEAAIDFCSERDLYPTISEISKERIRRAGAKILKDHREQSDALDMGFRVLKIDTSNMNDVHSAPGSLDQNDLLSRVENIKHDRSADDLLFQVMLNQGIDLSLPIASEILAGKPVYFVGEDALAACFDKDITEDVVKAMAERKPLYAIFRDDGFSSDDMKINTAQLFKQMTDEHTRVKVI